MSVPVVGDQGERAIHWPRVRRSSPFLVLTVLLLGVGFGIGLGWSHAPSRTDRGTATPAVRPASVRVGNSVPVRAHERGAGTSPEPATAASLGAAVIGGRFVAPVAVGGLTIDPAPPDTPPAPLGLNQADATTDVGYTSGVGATPKADSTPTVGFGLVTVRGLAAPAGTPTLRETPAWVGIVLGVNERAAFCPLERDTTSSTAPFQAEDRAAIFYGEGGRGADLYDTGGSAVCGGSLLPPSLKVAQALVPVPWQQQGSAGLATTVTYQAPQCARLAGVGASGNVHTGVYSVEVEVTFPFARTACDGVKAFTTTVTVSPPPAPGAPAPPGSVTLVPSTATAAVPTTLVGPLTG